MNKPSTESCKSPRGFLDNSHFHMNCAQGEIVAALESHGLSPCDAIKAADAAMSIAWKNWNDMAQMIETQGALLNRKDLVRTLAEKHGDAECEVDWMLADIEAIAGDPRLSHLTVEQMFAHWLAYSESMFAGWMDMGNAGAERLLRWIENGDKDAGCILRGGPKPSAR